ncbi:MAG: hypothetical protein ACRCWP_09590 [Shewanella sp.]
MPQHDIAAESDFGDDRIYHTETQANESSMVEVQKVLSPMAFRLTLSHKSKTNAEQTLKGKSIGR